MDLITVYPENPPALHDLDADEAVADVGDAGSSRVYVAADVYNPDATGVAYLQIFDMPAADVELGTDPPIASFALPPGRTLASHGYQHRCPDGMSYAVTATRTGSDPPPSPVDLTLYYV